MGFRPEWGDEQMLRGVEYIVSHQRRWEDTGWRLCLREGKFELDNIGFWSSKAGDAAFNWRDEHAKSRLKTAVHSLVQANLSLHLHVFGDLASKHALQLLHSAEAAAPCERADRRHKLAHVYQLQQTDEELACAVNATLVYQPLWFSDAAWHTYDEEAKRTHREMMLRGNVCYGSDWDISS